jgi:hypothetical protein
VNWELAMHYAQKVVDENNRRMTEAAIECVLGNRTEPLSPPEITPAEVTEIAGRVFRHHLSVHDNTREVQWGINPGTGYSQPVDFELEGEPLITVGHGGFAGAKIGFGQAAGKPQPSGIMVRFEQGKVQHDLCVVAPEKAEKITAAAKRLVPLFKEARHELTMKDAIRQAAGDSCDPADLCTYLLALGIGKLWERENR